MALLSLLSPSLVTLLTTLLLLDPANAGASSGCGKALAANQKPGGGSLTSSLKTSDGKARSYRTYIPTLYSPTTPAPLILNYHGRGSSAAQQEQLTSMSDSNFNNASIVAYPDGLNAQWQGDPDAGNIDDISFTQQLVSTLLSQYCIDPSRIYAVGSSNGGGFIGNYLACSDWGSSNIAVYGAAYGAFYTNTSDKACNSPTARNRVDAANVPIFCNSTKQDVPMIEFHGTSDDTIPYDGGDRRGLCLPSIPHWVTQWATRTGLPATNVSNPAFKQKAMKYQFGEGPKQGQVTHFQVFGLGHTWPTTLGKDPAPFNATEILMRFLNKWGPGDGKGYTGTATGGSPTGGASGPASSTKAGSAASAYARSYMLPLLASVFVWALTL